MCVHVKPDYIHDLRSGAIRAVIWLQSSVLPWLPFDDFNKDSSKVAARPVHDVPGGLNVEEVNGRLAASEKTIATHWDEGDAGRLARKILARKGNKWRFCGCERGWPENAVRPFRTFNYLALIPGRCPGLV